VVLSLRVLYRRLQVNSALAWIVILIAMPIAGPVLYVLFGDPTLGGRRLHLGQRIRRYYENAYAIAEADGPELSMIPSPFDAQARSIAQGQRLSGPVAQSLYHPHRRGDHFEQHGPRHRRAQSDARILYHRPQRPGRSRARRCAARGGTGVSCKILADDYGSKAFFRSRWPARLKAAGVGVLRSLPVALAKSFRNGRICATIASS
jgi:cardiolipin synthase